MPKVPAINKDHAQTIYGSVLEKLYGTFRAIDRPDFRMLGLEGHSIVVPGVFGEHKLPTWLKIIFTEENFSEPDIIRHFNRTGTGEIYAPRIRLRGETSVGYPWFISDDATDSHFINPSSYLNGDPRLSRHERAKVAQIFWTLTKNVLSNNPLSGPSPAPVIWFDDTISNILKLGQETGALRRRLIAPSTLLEAVETLRHASADFPAPGTHFSHGSFSNDKLRVSNSGYTLLDWGDAKFVPFMYDATFWIWHASLFSWNVSTKKWLLEIEDYEDAFCGHPRRIAGIDMTEENIRLAFRACLLERMLSALLVDSSEKILTSLSLLEARQVLRNMRAALRLTIQGLS